MGKIRDKEKEVKKEEGGKKEENMKLVQGVDAPKWCNNNPYLFVKKHREYLESIEVSNTINLWINMIFGSKQKGKEGQKIHNLYNLQTYENYEKTYDSLSKEDKEISC